MHDAGPPHDSPGSPPRGSRWWRVAVPLLVLLGLGMGLYLVLTGTADYALQDAVAEADRLEPNGWRLDDIEAQRAVPPAGENSAFLMLQTRNKLPSTWAGSQQFNDLFQEPLPPEHQLNAPQLAALRAELGKVGPALIDGRKLAGLPQGRYLLRYSPDFIGTLMPHAQEARQMFNLLHYDALLRAQDGDADGAVASCRACLNAARSLGDEPLAISQLVRVAGRVIVVTTLERVLAQGEPSPDALAGLQQALEEEEPENLMLYLTRGERAGSDQLMQFLQEGGMNLSGIRGLLSGPDDKELAAEMMVLYVPGAIRRQRAALLRHMTQVVEAAKLPDAQRDERLAELEKAARSGPLFVHLLAPALSKVGAGCERSQAQLRCAIVALAAERYRRQHGRWPESADALVQAGLLKEVPADPYDGAPLRFRRTDDGLLVYCVGPDKQDDGGNLDRSKPQEKGTDLGFRLWDVAKRRQLPLPPKPPESGAGMPGGLPPGAPPPGEPPPQDQ